MTTVPYLKGRQQYQRPQAILFANNQGTIVTYEGDNYYVPLGVEVGQDATDPNGYQFLITSDDNRGPIDFKEVRLEKRERTINGRMRSYHIADKLQISMSWDMLPSRGFAASPAFYTTGDHTGKPNNSIATSGSYSGFPYPVKTTTPEYDTTTTNIPAVTVKSQGNLVTIPERTVYNIDGHDEEIIVIPSVTVKKQGDYVVIPERTVYNAKHEAIVIPEHTVFQGMGTKVIPEETIIIPSTNYAVVIPSFKVYQGTSTQTIPSSTSTSTIKIGATSLYGTDVNGTAATNFSEQYTTDGGAGGVELLDWYENNPGSFWVYLAYDKYSNFGKKDAAYQNLNKYNQVVEVFFSDFSYTVEKRGGSNYDFWSVTLTLEEV